MTYIDVLEAIAGRVAALWPERMLYRDFCPADHKRPSGYLYAERAEPEDASIRLVQWSLEARLELYAATDEYSVESTEQLRADQAGAGGGLCALFRPVDGCPAGLSGPGGGGHPQDGALCNQTNCALTQERMIRWRRQSGCPA